MNIVVLKGRLVRDSEIREFQGGGKVLSNAMALSRVWYDNNGNKHEETDFVDIKANNGTADFIAKWFKKGDGISIKGRTLIHHIGQETESKWRMDSVSATMTETEKPHHRIIQHVHGPIQFFLIPSFRRLGVRLHASPVPSTKLAIYLIESKQREKKQADIACKLALSVN